jgi:hypothetical protein
MNTKKIFIYYDVFISTSKFNTIQILLILIKVANYINYFLYLSIMVFITKSLLQLSIKVTVIHQ